MPAAGPAAWSRGPTEPRHSRSRHPQLSLKCQKAANAHPRRERRFPVKHHLIFFLIQGNPPTMFLGVVLTGPPLNVIQQLCTGSRPRLQPEQAPIVWVIFAPGWPLAARLHPRLLSLTSDAPPLPCQSGARSAIGNWRPKNSDSRGTDHVSLKPVQNLTTANAPTVRMNQIYTPFF